MHKCNHGAANDATNGGRQESHHQYQYGEESSEFMPPQRDKGKEGGACMNKDGGEEGPEKDMIPHLAKCVEACIRAQTHHIDNAVQLIRVVRFGEHDQISQWQAEKQVQGPCRRRCVYNYLARVPEVLNDVDVVAI